MGKGDTPRPKTIAEQEFAKRWEETFRKEQEQQNYERRNPLPADPEEE